LLISPTTQLAAPSPPVLHHFPSPPPSPHLMPMTMPTLAIAASTLLYVSGTLANNKCNLYALSPHDPHVIPHRLARSLSSQQCL
jgi:hypothetical protein